MSGFAQEINIRSPEITAEQYAQARSILNLENRDSATNHEHRFSNKDEVIRIRYSVSPENIKLELERVFGCKFFSGVESDNRPLAIVTFPTSDYNGAFGQWKNVGMISPVESLMTTHKVVYYEVESESEFIEALSEGTQRGNNPSSILLIGGHGNQGSLQLGSDESREDHFIDLNDLDLRLKTSYAVERGGQVVLFSCSTGRGNVERATIDNVADFLHSAWPQASLSAPMLDTSYVNLTVDLDTLRLNLPTYADAKTFAKEANFNALILPYPAIENFRVDNGLLDSIRNGHSSINMEHERSKVGNNSNGKPIYRYSEREDVRAVQRMLNLIDPRFQIPEDGKFGDLTHAILQNFKATKGIRSHGIIDRETVLALDEQINRIKNDV